MSVTLGPIFDQPLHRQPWCDYGKLRGKKADCPRWDFRVTNTFDGPDYVNGGKHRATDMGNAGIGYPVLSPISAPMRHLTHFDTARAREWDLGGGYRLRLWHLSPDPADPKIPAVGTSAGPWRDVRIGEVVAKTGNSGGKLLDGSPMPAHTHAELLGPDGQPIDPEPYLFGQPLTLMEEDMDLPAGLRALVVGTLGVGNRLRADPMSTEGSRIMEEEREVQLLGSGVAGEPYTLGGKRGDEYLLVGVYGHAWYVARPLVVSWRLKGDGEVLATDCTALENKLDRARSAVAGASQALGAAQAALA